MAHKESPQHQPDKWQQELPKWKREMRKRKINDFKLTVWEGLKKAKTVFSRKK